MVEWIGVKEWQYIDLLVTASKGSRLQIDLFITSGNNVVHFDAIAQMTLGL